MKKCNSILYSSTHLPIGIFTCILYLFLSNSLISQNIKPYQRDYLAKTPEAETFNKYGDLSVNLFTGSANVSIPIYSTDMGISINIGYNTSGLKPEQHHGWVGLGWNLEVGGMISRIKRGEFDEWKPSLSSEIPVGYLDNYQLLNTNTNGEWYSSSILNEKTCESCNANPRNRFADLEPDEFVFNFLGHSGSIMLNHEGKWVLRTNRSESLKLKDLTPIIVENYRVNRQFNNYKGEETTEQIRFNPRVILGFIIITNDGTEYTFGGDYESVDFTYDLVSGNEYKNIMPSSWHLKKVKEVSGKVTNFLYQKDEFNITSNRIKNSGTTTLTTPSYTSTSSLESDELSYTLMDVSYLAEIQTPYEIIKFTRERLLGYADYNLDKDLTTPNFNYSQFGVNKSLSRWFQLNSIKVYNKSNPSIMLSSFSFEYTKSPSNRLQLKKVHRENVDNIVNKITLAEFVYNTKVLPPYNDVNGKMDHWGFYNNKALNISSESSYFTSREPDTTYVYAETLNKIIYPTGGYTELVFEPHDYSIKVKKISPSNPARNTPYDVEILNSNALAGGLRIREIKNIVDGNITLRKEYFYRRGYESGGNISSGALDGEPIYYDKVNTLFYLTQLVNFNYLHEQSLNPLNQTSGSPVTYSEVVEKREDGSYTIHKFSNNDNSTYRNRISIDLRSNLYTSSVERHFTDPVIDLESLRGKELQTSQYNGLNQLVARSIFEYTSNVDDNRAIRSIYSKNKLLFSGTQGVNLLERRAVAYLIHTTPILLIKKTDYIYEKFANVNNEVATITSYKYDDYLNIKEEAISNTDSKSNTITTYSYAFDPLDVTKINPNVSESVIGIKKSMIDQNMVGIPLEIKNNFNKGRKIEYNNFNGVLLPYIYYSQNRLGNFIEQYRINSYSNFDKPTQIQQKNTVSSSSSPTLTITNYEWQEGILRRMTYGGLSWEQNYDPNKRLLTETRDENGLFKKFSYDGYRRLIEIKDRYSKDGNGNPTNVQATKTYRYHYKNQILDSGDPSVDIDKNFVATQVSYLNAPSMTRPLVTKQYADGLGRPIGMVKEYYTPNQLHQKAQIRYDNLGRQYQVTQPFERSALGYDGNTFGVPYYTQTEYEASPLSRPLRQIFEDGRSVETAYSANSSSDNVRLFNVTNARIGDTALMTVTIGGSYAANTLYKTIVWDENGTSTSNFKNEKTGRTEVFKDKLDRVILTRKFVKDATGTIDLNVDTYNVYDDYGNLVMVIPPDAISTTDKVIYNLTFQYGYDNQYRLIEKKIPGAKSQKFFYNDKDQLVLTQDGNMRNPLYGGSNSKFLATIYDNVGRPEQTGWTYISTGSDGNPVLDAKGDYNTAITISVGNRLTSTQFYQNINGVNATNWVKHQENKVLRPVGVNVLRDYIWSYTERRPGYEYTGNPIWMGKQHLLCETWNYYAGVDNTDRPIDDNDYDGVDWNVSAYNGAQMPTVTYHYTYSTNYAQQVRTMDQPAFDHSLRQTQLNHAFSMGGNGLPATFPLSNMVYNSKDQLIEKNLGYNSTYSKYLQSIDYTYNTRGWLTGINQLSLSSSSTQQMQILTPQTPTTSTTIQNLAIAPYAYQAVKNQIEPYRQANADLMSEIDDQNPDLYSQTITYDTPDSRFGATPQYNGNISSTYWKVAGREMQGYGFKYDNLNRLTEGNYYDIVFGVSSTPTFQAGKFTEKVLEYDLRGNIKKLYRTGFKETEVNATNDVVANYGEIDNLIYAYDAQNLNRIRKITDGTSTANMGKGFKFGNSTDNEDYKYDDNGNLIYDKNKGILKITYNYLNLPESIDFGTTTATKRLIFVYDASGYKHRKIAQLLTSSGGLKSETITDYVGGREYTSSSTSLGVQADPANSALQRIHHAEGAITQEAGTTTWQYEYILRDHLDNTRVTFKDKNSDGTLDYWSIPPSTNEISQINHYYPFGLNMEGNWTGAKGANKYQYNGKEWNDDFGLGWNDYGARFYDPSSLRWWSVDKLSEETEQIDKSPFAYAWNNPILLDDPDGNCPFCPIVVGALKVFGVGFVIGAGADATAQIVSNKVQGKSAFEGYSVSSTLLSGFAGGVSGGAAGITNTTTRTVVKLGISSLESISKQIITDEAAKNAVNGDFSKLEENVSKVNIVQTASDVTMGELGGRIKVKTEVDPKILERQLDRTTRVAARDPSKGRVQNVLDAKEAITNNKNAGHVNNYTGGVSGNSLQNISNATIVPVLNGKTGTPVFTPKQITRDNTRTQVNRTN